MYIVIIILSVLLHVLGYIIYNIPSKFDQFQIQAFLEKRLITPKSIILINYNISKYLM